MNSVTDFIIDNAGALATKVRQRMKPLHDPASDPLHPQIATLLRKPKGPQGHLITGAVKALTKQRDIVWALSMATGKSFSSLATTHCLANGKPYAALIVCPPHLVDKWQREIKATIPGAKCITVDGWREWLALSRAPKAKIKQPTFFLSPISTVKLGAQWRAAALLNKRSGLYHCPRCQGVIYAKKEQPADGEWLSRSKRRCKQNISKPLGELAPCAEALWQACGKEKIEPAKIVKRFMRRWFDVCIIDEAHQEKGEDTLAGRAISDLMAGAKKIMLLTGTLIAGRCEDLRPTFYRLYGRRFKELDFGWEDDFKFAARYGKIQTTVRTTETSDARGTRTGSGSAKRVSRKIIPGIMPHLYGDFVADRALFLSLDEMGEALPRYDETTNPLTMPPALAASYQEMAQVLLAKFKDLYREDRGLAMRLLSPMAEALLTYPDDPIGWELIGYKDREGGYHPVYKPRDIELDLPKERQLVDTIREQNAAGNQVWVYSTRHATSDRLVSLLKKAGLNVGHLKQSIEPRHREAWIRQNAPGLDCMVSHPKLVETGLELFGQADNSMFGQRYNFPVLCWYSTGYELNVLRQASARSWRIGQTKPCTTQYLYYENTAQDKAIQLMAKKLQAAKFLEGNLEGGGLLEETGEDIALAVCKQLAEGISKASAA